MQLRPLDLMAGQTKSVPVLDRLVLYLHHHDPMAKGGKPTLQTQSGLADGIGIQRKHVPRAIRRLVEAGHVKLVLQHVQGHRQRLRVHVLTTQGVEKARGIRLLLKDETVSTDEGDQNLLQLIDTGRMSVVQNRQTDGEPGTQGNETKGSDALEMAARILGTTRQDIDAMLLSDLGVSADDQPVIDGSEAVFLACLHTALTDAVITKDEEAILIRLRRELGPFGAPLKAHVMNLLHDMLK